MENEPLLQEDDHDTILAQTGQSVIRPCKETFNRLEKQKIIDVNGIIAAGVSWSDPDYTQAQALFNIVNNFKWGSAWTYFNPS